MSKQRPTADRITNELAGASAFFKPAAPAPAAMPPVIPETPGRAPKVTPPPSAFTRAATTPESSPRTPRTAAPSARRQMIRHPFELYMDQLDSLRELAEAQRRRGEPASMSRMVREALDRFLDERT